jgi:predicted SAM-dependent methyltransferase
MPITIRKIRYFLKYLRQWTYYAYYHFEDVLPIIPEVKMDGLKVHLGPGSVNIQGWVNVDARDLAHVHIISEGFILDEFKDNSIDQIYLCHVLEHFSFLDANMLIKRLRKKLKINGILRISVPDFDVLVEMYIANNKNINIIKHPLMGGQGYKENFHMSVYNKTMLCDLLKECGFYGISIWDTIVDFGTSLDDWSSKTIQDNRISYSISLNIKAKKMPS